MSKSLIDVLTVFHLAMSLRKPLRSFINMNRIGKITVSKLIGDLPIEFDSIRNDQNDRIFQLLLFTPQFRGGENHDERLSRSLPVPDNSPFIRLFSHALDDFIDRRKLLVTADLFDDFMLFLAVIEDDEIPDDIEQVFLPENARNQNLLHRRIRTQVFFINQTQINHLFNRGMFGHAGNLIAVRRLPLMKMFQRSFDDAVFRSEKITADQYFIRIEKLGDFFLISLQLVLSIK